jgi:hypothetical protein
VQTPSSKTPIAIAIAGYILLIAAVIAGMFAWRRDVLADMATPEAQSEWNDWRTKAAEQDGKHAPVQLTVSKSPQPPVLVLMRDYFPACVIGLLVPLSALYAFIAWLICGVLGQSNASPNYSQQHREQ